MTIILRTYIDDKDWSESQLGWCCDALRITGIQLQAIFNDGVKVDNKSFSIENDIIRWTTNPRPTELLVVFSVANDLSKVGEEKLLLEQEKLKLEKKNNGLENILKFIFPVNVALMILVIFGMNYFSEQSNPKTVTLDPPRIHTQTKKISISEDQCINSIEKEFENYGLENIKPVRGGVYSTQGNYNIFVVCEEDAQVAFIVVSGPEDSKAKKIREDIKRLIP